MKVKELLLTKVLFMVRLCDYTYQFKLMAYWEENNEGYPKFLDWDKFHKELRKDFCPTHSDIVAINKLESTTYYQKTQFIDDYLDKFVELAVEARYTDPKTTVVKFWKGLYPQIQNTIAMMV